MPYNYKIDVEQQKVVVEFFGYVDGDDINNALTEVFLHNDWRLAYDHFWDGSRVETLDFDYSQFKRIKGIVQQIKPAAIEAFGPMAVIVPNRIAYVVVRAAHATFTAYKPFGIFKKIKDAETWVDRIKKSEQLTKREKQNVIWQCA